VTRRTGWWRENRWWLPALPFAAAALVAASAYNVKDYWYDGGLHQELGSARAGQFVTATDHYEDALGKTSRTFRVRLASVQKTDRYPYADQPGPPPAGTTAWQVDLDWAADPDQALRFCTVSLVDDEGRRYDTDDEHIFSTCTQDGHAGPDDPTSPDDVRGTVPEGEERPSTWSTRPVVLVPDGRKITQVLVWWETPRYVKLSVP
jgi:hypothetical protein